MVFRKLKLWKETERNSSTAIVTKLAALKHCVMWRIPLAPWLPFLVMVRTRNARVVAWVEEDATTSSSASIDREREQCCKLDLLQGQCISRILSYHYGADRGFNGFMMELLQSIPHEFDAWTAEEIASIADYASKAG